MNRIMKFLTIPCCAAIMNSCCPGGGSGEPQAAIGPQIQAGDVTAAVNLTVSESKRMIAKGIAQHPLVQEKMRSGMVIITRGTTNTYIAEELAGLQAPHGSFMTGNVTPVGVGPVNEGMEMQSEIVLVDGRQVEMSYADALERLGPDDVIFKGGNMLNYEKKQAAVCVGAPDGGTVARLTPYVGPGKARLIIPIGLEKEVWGDLAAYEKALTGGGEALNWHPKVRVFEHGDVFTEIEALKLFAQVGAFPFAAGGIAGREGGISLIVYGSEAEVRKALDLVASIQGEKPFVDSGNAAVL